MIDARDMAARNAAVTALLRQKHGVRAKTLHRAVGRAGRLLPKRIRAQAEIMIEAERLVSVPKLAKRVDVAAVARAEQVLTAHLEAVDVKDRRKGQILSLIGVIAAQILIIVTAFILWLWWRGYV